MPLKPLLSPLEQDVMNAIWSAGAATAADIQTALAPQRILRDSTVRTLLTRLEGKGYLQHGVEGRTCLFQYRTTQEFGRSRREANRRSLLPRVRRIAARWHGG